MAKHTTRSLKADESLRFGYGLLIYDAGTIDDTMYCVTIHHYLSYLLSSTSTGKAGLVLLGVVKLLEHRKVSGEGESCSVGFRGYNNEDEREDGLDVEEE